MDTMKILRDSELEGKMAEMRCYTTMKRREWLLELVKHKTWYVVKTRGQIKRLAEIFGVHRHTIEKDLKLIEEEASVADIGLIEMDARHLMSRALVRANERADDLRLSAGERARYNQQILNGIPKMAKILEVFGKKERDMSPPPSAEERPGDAKLDQIARDFAREWEAKQTVRNSRVL